MADAKLIAIVEANTKQFENALRRLEQIGQTSMNKQAQSAQRLEQSFNRLGSSASRAGSFIKSSLVGSLASLTAGLSVQKVLQYADAWTRAGNQLAAATQISGKQARSLEDINKIATSTRSSLEETVQLYARVLRATQGLSVSEKEVARITTTVNEAFKAGGAATSEQIAGILQLGQAISSGLLQGDELRSIRENAPLIAQAIADEFKTTIGGLKALGAAGELTSERVLRAILNGQTKIHSAFAVTSKTMAEGVTLVGNAFTQFIGFMNESTNASGAFISGLNGIASALDALPGAVKSFRSELDKLNESPFWDKFIVTQSEAADFKKQLDAMDAATAKANAGPTTVQGATSALLENFKQQAQILQAGLTSPQQNKEIEDIIILLGQKTPEATQKAIAAIDKLAHETSALTIGDFDDNFLRLGVVLQADIDKIKELGKAALLLELGKIEPSAHFAGPENASDLEKTASIERIRQQEALSARLIAEAAKSEVQKKDEAALAKTIKDIQKAAEEAHVELSAGATDVLAKLIQAAEKIASAFDATQKQMTEGATDTMALLRRLENPKGPWATPHFDTTRLRIGYSSDTQTNQMGRVTDVTAASTSTVADAERDLARRARDLEERILKIVGDDMFKKLNTGAIAAIASIGYNYGADSDTFKKIAASGKGGSAVDVSTAILGLTTGDPRRHRIEAETALTGAPGGEAALEALKAGNEAMTEAAKKSEELKQAKDELFESMRQEVDAAKSEVDAIGKTTFEIEHAAFVQAKLNEAKQDGLEITPELTERINQQADAYASWKQQLDNASTSADKLQTSQQASIAQMDELRSFSSGVLSGFISDMVHGKTAAEALQGALGKIADKLLDIASNQIISALFAPTGQPGGGLLGGFLNFGASAAAPLPAGGLFAKGGVMTSRGPVPLKRYQTGGVASSPQMAMFGEGSRPEAYVPLPDGRRIPVNLHTPRISNMGSGNQRVAVDNVVRLEPSEMFHASVESRVRQGQAETFRAMPGYLGDQRARAAGSAR